MADYLPKFLDGEQVTLVAGTGGVTGGQLVTTAGLPAGATALNVAGVASRDAAAGQTFGCYRIGIHRLVAGTGGLTVGQPVKAGAAGTAVLWVTGTDDIQARIGRAWSTASAGASVDVALFGV